MSWWGIEWENIYIIRYRAIKIQKKSGHDEYLEERNSKRNPSNNSKIGLQCYSHQGETALQEKDFFFFQNNLCYDFVDLGVFRNSGDLTRWYTTDAAVLRSLSSAEVQFTPAVMLQQLLGMPSFLKYSVFAQLV